MNPSIITVPATSGAQGLSVSDYVLDRVSGDVEKNMGQVVENAFAGASVALTCLVVLSSVASIRRAFVFESASLVAGLRDSVLANRQGAIYAAFDAIIPGAETLDLAVADLESTLKGKEWTVPGLTQTAGITGTSGFGVLDLAFTPAKKQLTLAALIAKLEDLSIDGDAVAVLVNQEYPEVYIATGAALDLGASDATVGTEFGSPIAKINGVFQSVSAEVNPKFGFESGGTF